MTMQSPAFRILARTGSRWLVRSVAFAALALGPVVARLSATSLGLAENLVAESPTGGAFPLVAARTAVPVFVDEADFAGVARAASDLCSDVERVTGLKPELVTRVRPGAACMILAGTLGHSPVIDELAKQGKIPTEAVAGQWESFCIATVSDPLPGVKQALVIAGSDRRGTIYGLYEISEQIGVSPWYWWADVPARHRDELFIRADSHVQGPPAVKYRGIFINDEEPALGPWSREKFGGVNSKMYTHMFELLLRLRANYLWPAMWGKSFFEDDPESARLADEYGIVMGTSHHEPLMRAHKDWETRRTEYGNGEWNYLSNKAGLKRFWEEGIQRNRTHENLITVGMRGNGDMGMPSTGSMEGDIGLLEQIIADQREIIARELKTEVTRVPQLWALFTEVQKFYEHGMKVPDDVTLLFCDDNVGDLRRLPTPEERRRSGGSGIYYHLDMNGGPFSYKWLNSNPLPKIWEQMNLASEYGATRIWIANVGDLKPLEVPIEFFLRFAWNPSAIRQNDIAAWTRRWAERDFGQEHAEEIADLVSKYAKYNGWRKPEMIRPGTFSLVNFREAERVSAAWNDVAARADKLSESIPASQRDAYYELVLHPAKACANFVNLYISAGRNALYAKQGRTSANAEAQRVRELFAKDQEMSDFYNEKVAGGKWRHMMDQTHIGYTSWESPKTNIMPTLATLSLPEDAKFGVALEGSEEVWPGSATEAALPAFDSLSRQRSYFDIFARGTLAPKFRYKADKDWILISEGKVPDAGNDTRVWVDIDWNKVPEGTQLARITVWGEGQEPAVISVSATKATADQVREARGAFGSLTGTVSFWAKDALVNETGSGVRWEFLPDYGRGEGAMTVFPVTAATLQPPAPAPYLEYPVYIPHAGKIDVDLVTANTLDTIPGRGLGIAVSFDDQPPQVHNVFTPETTKSETFLGSECFKNCANNARTLHVTCNLVKPGRHMLRITMVDPTMVVQKIILHDAPLPTSYFGPPESARNGEEPK